jgi:hypothetical protein
MWAPGPLQIARHLGQHDIQITVQFRHTAFRRPQLPATCIQCPIDISSPRARTKKHSVWCSAWPLPSSGRGAHLRGVAVVCFRQPARGRLPAPWQGSRAPSLLRCACRSGRRPGPLSAQIPPGSAAALQESWAHAVRSIGPARRLLIGESPGWQGTNAQGAHAQHAPEPGPADSGD